MTPTEHLSDWIAPKDGRRETDKKPASRTFWLGVAGTVLAGVLLWLFTTAANGGIVTGSRFVSDSIRRDGDKAAMEATLNRIDSRVGAIYCASLPPDKQPGCR